MKFSVRTRLVMLAMTHGIPVRHALDETEAITFRRMIEEAKARRRS